MSRRFAFFAFMLTSAVALAESEYTPLRRRITSILDMGQQNRLADARLACDDAMRSAGDPPATAAERAMLFSTCGSVAARAGDLAGSRTLLETALSLWQEALGATNPQVGSTMLDLARLHRLAGRYQLSQQQSRTALNIYEASYGPKSSMLIEPLVSLGLAEIMLGRYADAESNLNRAVSLAQSGDGRNIQHTLFSALGLLNFNQGRYFEAERWYRRAAMGGSAPDAARTLAGLANVYIATARYDKADAACSQALELLISLFGPRHAEVASALQILADVRHRQRRHLEAADLLHQALDIVVQLPNPNRLIEAIILNSLGVSYISLGRYAEGESSFRKAVLIQESLGNDARRDLSLTLHNLAVASSRQGRNEEALELASRALAIREADLPQVDSGLLELMVHKVELLRRAHRKTEAASLEHVAHRIAAERGLEDPHRWIVDLRELQRKK